MKPDLRPYLGRRVTVVVDRPLGSPHPRFPEGEPYPVNYGYLAGTMSGDGGEIDAYVLGLDVAVERAEGVVIAVVVRGDDVEDKLVVAVEGWVVTAEEVWARVEFQERYFDSEVVVLGERGARRGARLDED
ncbi:MAG: inorganic pyrophosphatase [Chloroflexia bacterium]